MKAMEMHKVRVSSYALEKGAYQFEQVARSSTTAS